MSEIHQQHNEIDRSISKLLEIFHTDTQQKLHLAPMHSRPLLHSDTGIFQLADDGWPEDCDDLDQDNGDPHPANWPQLPAKDLR